MPDSFTPRPDDAQATVGVQPFPCHKPIPDAADGETSQPVTPALVQLYVEALGDEYAPMRQHAAIMLGNFGPHARAAVPALHRALWDESRGVRQAVASALNQITAPGSADLEPRGPSPLPTTQERVALAGGPPALQPRATPPAAHGRLGGGLRWAARLAALAPLVAVAAALTVGGLVPTVFLALVLLLPAALPLLVSLVLLLAGGPDAARGPAGGGGAPASRDGVAEPATGRVSS
jgi:HEAT repeat protein